ncbi:MAG: aldo/keto reductase, partial [Lachnospiraceae bacterium]|nr:aldo/keto reductase [Lachnospiraceae bacterium]
CDAHGIRVEAWGPLGKGRDLRDGTVADIARRHGKTPAQVVLRWNLQRGVIVIPKSVHEERLTENAGIFDFSLDETEMRALSALDTNETQRSYMPGYRWEG